MTPNSPHDRTSTVDFGIVTPMSGDFDVYGGSDVVARARAWAMAGGYAMITGRCTCPHGLAGVDCLSSTCHRLLDHGNLWVEATTGVPFVLAHDYHSAGLDKRLADYAAAWGLDLTLTEDGDGADAWYYPGNRVGVTAVRLTPAEFQTWPLERELQTVLAEHPIDWPDESA